MVRVLVIDDDPDDRRLAARALSQELDSPDIVEIGDDTTLELALRDSAAPALAVTDYALNWSDGLAVFQRIRAAYPHCPVIAFTGVGDEALAVELIKAGVEDYVVKSERKRLGGAARAAIERTAERQQQQKAEKHYRDLFQSMPIGLYECAADGTFSAGNSALLVLLGLRSEDDLYHARLDAHVVTEAPFRWPEIGDKPWTAEVQLRRSDNTFAKAVNVVHAICEAGRVVYRGALIDVQAMTTSSSE
jgi:CheY-like chemotaxis protein